MNRKFFKTFIRDCRGALAPMMAILIPVVVSAVGISVDMSRAYLVHDRLAQSLDSAGLAAAASSGNEAAIEERFHDFFNANYPESALGDPYNVDIQQFENEYVVSADADVDTTFVRLIGYNTLTVRAEARIRRDVRGLEVALVLDNTGSLWSTSGGRTNIRAVKDAAIDFVNILYDRADDEDYIYTSIVPYAATVNPGAEAVAITNNPYVATWIGTAYAPYSTTDNTAWKGCVIERAYPNDIEDTSVAAGGYWTPFRWLDTAASPTSTTPMADNNWRNNNGSLNLSMPSGPLDAVGSSRNSNNWRHPNLGCPTPIVPLTNNRTNLLTELGNLTAWNRGGTLGNVGMAWGVRVLSPEEPFTQGAEWSDDSFRKVMVMMTDGNNEIYCEGSQWHNGCNDQRSDMTAFRRVSDNVLGTTSRATALTRANTRMSETCAYAKSLGITVYTITFSTSLNSTTRDLYRNCATDANKYYNAPTQADLLNAFQQISRELSNLRIEQ